LSRTATIVSSGPPTGLTLAQGSYVVEYLPLNSGSTGARLVEFDGTVAANDIGGISHATATSIRGWTTAGGVLQSSVVSGAVVTVGSVHKAGYTASVGSAIVSVD